ncbi:MAG: PAS domain-containing protein [Myxococcota bacterium]|nr:PAS domain-containing protein [Myxococcota bacterium]
MTKRSGVDGPSPAADPARGGGASVGAWPHPGSASRLFVGDDAALVPATAQEVLDGLYEGRLGLDTPIRVSQDRAPGPLRAFLRDLVFLAHQEERAQMGWQRLDEDAFAKVFRGAAVGFAIADLSGRLVEANPALCALLGRDESTLLGSLV